MKETESSSKDMPCEHVLAAGDGLFTSRIASSHYVRSVPRQLSYLAHVLKRAESNRSRFRVSQSSRNREEKFDRFATYFADAATPFETSLLSNRAWPLCCDTADAGCPHPPPATAQPVERSPFDLADRFARAFEPSGDFLECVLATVRDAVPQFEHATFP